MNIRKCMKYCIIGISILLLVALCSRTNIPEPLPPLDTTIPTEVKIQLIDTPVLFPEVGYEVPVTKWEAIDLKDALSWYIKEIDNEISSQQYSDAATEQMILEVARLNEAISQLDNDIEKFNKWESEYPVATEVWFYLRNLQITEEVAAGIIGNMMIETSGGNLHLVPEIYSSGKGFYGLCQWSMHYYPEARDMTLYEQLDFLMATIEDEFSNYGFCYKKGFTYQDFTTLDSPEDVALAFAKVYERCSSASYGARKRAARVAYDYFISEV